MIPRAQRSRRERLPRARVFRLERTVELDVIVGDDHFALRIELFKAVGTRRRYRARLWRTEHFRIQPTFPQNRSGRPAHLPCDEEILTDWSTCLDGRWEDFEADSTAEALGRVLAAVRRRVARFGGRF